MPEAICKICRLPKGTLTCGLCNGAVCKKCAEVLKGNPFSFFRVTPPELAHSTYCGPCYDDKVAPALTDYQRTMVRARNIYVFEKDQGQETRFYRRIEDPLLVEDCEDREETLLRLAFFAAEAGFNALVDVEIRPKKIRNAGYQSTRWTGSGIPTQVDGAELDAKEKWRPSTYDF